MRRLLILVCLVSIAACSGKDSPTPTSPGTTTPTPVVTPTLYTLTGSMKNQAGVAIPGSSVVVVDGIHAGRSGAVGTDGIYRIENLSGNLNIAARATGYIEQVAGVSQLATSKNFTMVTVVPWSQSGSGDNVFPVPSYVKRVRIDATYGGSCQNFIVHASTQIISLVNIIIGTCSVADSRSPFSGTYAIAGGGQIEITNSTGVSWTFTEAR